MNCGKECFRKRDIFNKHRVGEKEICERESSQTSDKGKYESNDEIFINTHEI